MAMTTIFSIEVVSGGYIVDWANENTNSDNRQVFTSKAKVIKYLRDELTALEGDEATEE